MGGMLAMAMASQLEAQGEQVEFIGLIDTTQTLDSEWAARHNRAIEYLDYLAGYWPSAISHDGRQNLIERLEALPTEAQLDHLLEWARQQHLPLESLDIESIELQITLRDKGHRLMREHALKPVQAPLHIGWAEETVKEHGQRSPGDWSSFTTGKTQINVVAGDHWQILKAQSLHADLCRHLGDQSNQNM